ncbi:MAG: alpha/beta fold hydrolase [Bdellovibrionota bacterium]
MAELRHAKQAGLGHLPLTTEALRRSEKTLDQLESKASHNLRDIPRTGLSEELSGEVTRLEALKGTGPSAEKAVLTDSQIRHSLVSSEPQIHYSQGAANDGNMGVFRGSFDPPHAGQVEAIQKAVQSLGLKEILILDDGKGTSFNEATRARLAQLTFAKIPEARFPSAELAQSLEGKSAAEIFHTLAVDNHQVTSIAYSDDVGKDFFTAAKEDNVKYAVAVKSGDADATKLKSAAKSKGIQLQEIEISKDVPDAKSIRRALAKGEDPPGLADGVKKYIDDRRAHRATSDRVPFSEPNNEDPQVLLAKKLYQEGLEESISRRIVARDPDLAKSLLAKKDGQPARDLDGNAFHYRGVSLHPLDYDPKFESPDFKDKMFSGREIDAESYSNSSEDAKKFAEKNPHRKNLTMILELQIPKAAVIDNDGKWVTYTRNEIPDDTLVMNRVGLKDWDNAVRTPCNDNADGICVDAPVKWFAYDQVFDANGKVKPHFEDDLFPVAGDQTRHSLVISNDSKPAFQRKPKEFPGVVDALKAMPEVHTFDSKVDGTHLVYSVLSPEVGPKKALVIAQGKGESVYRYLEFAQEMKERGYGPILMLDHRGQGFSQAPVNALLKTDKAAVHVDKFDDYVKDFIQFVDDKDGPVKTELEKRGITEKPFIVAHSMGGAILNLALRQKADLTDAKRVAYVSPMFEIKMGSVMERLHDKPLEYLTGALRYVGMNDFAFGGDPQSAALSGLFRLDNAYAMERAMNIRVSRQTIAWANEAMKAGDIARDAKTAPAVESVIFQGKRDKLVNNSALQNYACSVTGCTLVELSGTHALHDEAPVSRYPLEEQIDNFFQGKQLTPASADSKFQYKILEQPEATPYAGKVRVSDGVGHGSKIAVFAGDFSPPSEAEVKAVRESIKKFGLNEVILLPGANTGRSPAEQRALAAIAFAGVPEARLPSPALDKELRGKPYSAAVDYLAKQNPLRTVTSLSGEDALKDAQFAASTSPNVRYGLIGKAGDKNSSLVDDFVKAKGITGKVDRIQTDGDLSSESIRAALARGESPEGISPNVESFLQKRDTLPTQEVRHSLVSALPSDLAEISEPVWAVTTDRGMKGWRDLLNDDERHAALIRAVKNNSQLSRTATFGQSGKGFVNLGKGEIKDLAQENLLRALDMEVAWTKEPIGSPAALRKQLEEINLAVTSGLSPVEPSTGEVGKPGQIRNFTLTREAKKSQSVNDLGQRFDALAADLQGRLKPGLSLEETAGLAAHAYMSLAEEVKPFFDGNGRTGHALVDYIFLREGYPPPTYFGNNVIDQVTMKHVSGPHDEALKSEVALKAYLGSSVKETIRQALADKPVPFEVTRDALLKNGASLEKELGRGQQGVALLVKRNNEELVAKSALNYGALGENRREVAMMKMLQGDPNLKAYVPHLVTAEPNGYWFLREYIKGPTAEELSASGLSSHKRQRFRELFDAVNRFESSSGLHVDFRPRNVVWSDARDSFVIADLGPKYSRLPELDSFDTYAKNFLTPTQPIFSRGSPVYSAQALIALEKQKPAVAAAVHYRDAAAAELANARHSYFSGSLSIQDLDRVNARYGFVETPVLGTSEPARRLGYLRQEENYIDRAITQARADKDAAKAATLTQARSAVSGLLEKETRARQAFLAAKDGPSARHGLVESITSENFFARYQREFPGRSLSQVRANPEEDSLLRALQARDAAREAAVTGTPAHFDPAIATSWWVQKTEGDSLSATTRAALYDGESAQAKGVVAAEAKNVAAPPAPRTFDSAVSDLETQHRAIQAEVASLAEKAKADPSLEKAAADARRAEAASGERLATLKENSEALKSPAPADEKFGNQATAATLDFLRQANDQTLAGLGLEGLSSKAASTGEERLKLYEKFKAQVGEMPAAKRAEVVDTVRAFAAKGKNDLAQAVKGASDDQSLVKALERTDKVAMAAKIPGAANAVLKAEKVKPAEAALASAVGAVSGAEKSGFERRAAALAETKALRAEARAPASIGKESLKDAAEHDLKNISETQRKELVESFSKQAAFEKNEKGARAALDHLKALSSNPDMFETYRLAYVHAAEELPKNKSWDQAWEAGVKKMLEESDYRAEEIMKVVDEPSGLKFYQQTARCLKI